MRRSILLTFLALGAVLTAIGGTGLFAALSDTARTGTNSVRTASLPGSADLQLATATTSSGATVCGTFSEDLTTGLFTATDVKAGTFQPMRSFCLKNLGSRTVTVSAMVESLTDVDVDCTGDEAASGDTTCGTNQAGELSALVNLQYLVTDCNAQTILNSPPPNGKLNTMTTAKPLGTLAPNAVGCYRADLFYPDDGSVNVQKAQSDEITWRFAFTGQA